jgi:F0F1-type ATP synthase assembly protein I
MNKSPQQSPWWGPGLAVFAEVTGWIAVPVVGALYLGRFLDQKYNTDPLFFLGLTALSFIITSFGIVKLATRFIREAELDVKKQKESENNLPVNSKKDDGYNT